MLTDMASVICGPGATDNRNGTIGKWNAKQMVRMLSKGFLRGNKEKPNGEVVNLHVHLTWVKD